MTGFAIGNVLHVDAEGYRTVTPFAPFARCERLPGRMNPATRHAKLRDNGQPTV